jgi:hypothetical protein
MTNAEIDEKIAQALELLEFLRALKRAPISGCADAPPKAIEDPLDLGIKDLIPAAEAAVLVKRAKSTMRTWCRANKIDGDEGFARQIGKRWWVSKSRLLRHLASGSRD